MPYKIPLFSRTGKLVKVKPATLRPKGLKRYSAPRSEAEAQSRAFWENHAGWRGDGAKIAPQEARAFVRSDPRGRRPG